MNSSNVIEEVNELNRHLDPLVLPLCLAGLVLVDDHEGNGNEEGESSSCPDAPDSLRWDREWGAEVIAEEADLNLEVLATVDHNLRVGGMDTG